MSDGVMTYEDWLRGCVYHDGRHGYVTLPCDEVLKIADFIERLRADSKTENSSEKPNNSTISKMEQVDEPQTDGFTKWAKSVADEYRDEPQTEPLQTCSVNGRPYTDCCNCEYFKCTADEPQTDWKDQMWAEAVEQREHDMLYEPTYDLDDGSM